MVFGLMNEPHDLDVPTWATTVQAAVTAIRNAGAKTQMILMPGTNFASAGQFVGSGSGAALLAVSNPGGGTEGLIMDLHKYLDEDNSGEHAICTTDNVDAFTEVATFLRANGRLGMVSETGAGSDATVSSLVLFVKTGVANWWNKCFVKFCAQNKFLNDNSDVFLGYVAWAAGSFATDYVLSLTPSKVNGKYVDNKLATQCVVAPFLNAAAGPSQASSAAAIATSGVKPTTTIVQVSTRSRVETVVVGTQTVTQSNSKMTSAVTSKPVASTAILVDGGNKTTAAVGSSGGLVGSSPTSTAVGGVPTQSLIAGGAGRAVGAGSVVLGGLFAALFL